MEENPLDRYLPEPIRSQIEQDYYARVNARARLEQAIHDPDFLQHGTGHIALFSDHGVVQVRDVARQILQVLKVTNGVLIPMRDQSRMDFFMHGYGVMAAYLHDIGMADFSAFGRAMHPEFAAQAVFTSALTEVIEVMWAENCGNVAWRLTSLARAGEANIASSELGPGGNLRLSFHRGAFATDAATRRAAYCAAYTVNDVQADVIDSFHGADRSEPNGSGALKSVGDIQILLESTNDNLAFVELIREELRQLNPAIAARIQFVPSLQNTSEFERTRYLEAGDLNWALSRRREALNQIARSGHKTEAIDLVEGFRHVKWVTLYPGETLIKAESTASFVYIPLGDGLKVMPLGGYAPFSVKAWMPLGNTGVIRGAIRNADVVADQEVSLLIIPKEVYLWHWHRPYAPEELKQLLAADVTLDPA